MSAENRLIELLPASERRCLLAIADPVQLVLGEVLCECGAPTRHVYFPVDGVIALATALAGRASLEVGMVGREGMLGAPLSLGVLVSPWRALVQGDGHCWRMEATVFRRQLARSPSLQHGLHRYLYVQVAELAASAACMRFHQIGPRLARWLLMSQDRAHADRFAVTHEFLASLLGVRRVGITLAAGALHSRGLIDYHRGHVHVLDRAGLEAQACACYVTGCRTYREQLGEG